MNKFTFYLIIMLFSSCAVTEYYQVFKTNPENGNLSGNRIFFEDDHCVVYYNLCIEGGNAGFSFYNKTGNDIIILLNKTFYVMNGLAYEYFQNRTFSKSTNIGTTVTSNYYPNYLNTNISKISGISSNSYSTTYTEKSELTIPPKTLINVSEYKVTNERYASCNLPKFPSRKEVKTLKYIKDNSPFVFYNLITYVSNGDTIRIENKFYVSEITNYPVTDVYNEIDTSACGDRLPYELRIQQFKYKTPDKFYIKYSSID